MPRAEVTQEIVKQRFSYDPDTGVFVRLVPSTNGLHPAGSVAGTRNRHGYLEVRINRSNFLLHRLAWLYVYGELPKGILDHINLNKADNRIANLRECNASQNVANGPLRSTSTTGAKGVGLCRRTGKYLARIYLNYKSIYLGSYNTVEEAKAAYAAGAVKYFGEFARTA